MLFRSSYSSGDKITINKVTDTHAYFTTPHLSHEHSILLSEWDDGNWVEWKKTTAQTTFAILLKRIKEFLWKSETENDSIQQ